ncbi:Uncharacterised protein [Bordetella pertussis]|nr:Uncharacterised protein [Bordetella pertussis]CPM51647.1 Uncharacterised protein [Bordetella pertussis]
MNGPFRPDTPGIICSSDTSTSSITISPVMEARRPTLPWMAGADRPFMPFSRMKPRILPSKSPPTHLAHTTNTSAMGELVIHILLPVSL